MGGSPTFNKKVSPSGPREGVRLVPQTPDHQFLPKVLLHIEETNPGHLLAILGFRPLDASIDFCVPGGEVDLVEDLFEVEMNPGAHLEGEMSG